MQTTNRALWESSGSLQRFGQLKLKGKSLNWKAGRIHREATKILEKLSLELDETRKAFGEEKRFTDKDGIEQVIIAVPPKDQKDFHAAWNKILDGKAEFWGDPFTPDELGDHLEELNNQDVGALSEWLIQGECSAEPKPATVTDIAEHAKAKEAVA